MAGPVVLPSLRSSVPILTLLRAGRRPLAADPASKAAFYRDLGLHLTSSHEQQGIEAEISTAAACAKRGVRGRSPAGVAPVDDEVAAGHEGGGRAGEVEHRAGDLLDLTEPLHRGTACAEFHHRVRDALVDPGQDVAGADGVDAYLVPDPLRGLGLRQLDDASLGRAVGRAASSAIHDVVDDHAGHRSRVDDRAAGPLRDHALGRRPPDEEHAAEIDVDVAPPALVVDVDVELP